MGVIYKLKPEVKEFILKSKQNNPILSCRGLVSLIGDNFKINLSKSTINAIIKEANLSMPVGRRRKKRRRSQNVQSAAAVLQLQHQVVVPQLQQQAEEQQVKEETRLPAEPQNLGIIFLKAADYLLGGSNYLSEEVKKHSRQDTADILAKIEKIIYWPLFGSPKDSPPYLDYLQQVKELPSNLLNIISGTFLDISGVKVISSNNSVFYLDSQFYTVWSTPYIPADFSSSIYNIKGYIDRCFHGYEPLVLFMIPGYDLPTKEFFDFLLSLEGVEKGINSLTIYGDKLKELEAIAIGHKRKRYFVFGLWPWQSIESRKVKKIGEFRPFRFEALKLELYLADAELSLLQPNTDKWVTLRGCALKGNLNEKIRLLVLTNLPGEQATAEEMLSLYLSRWPNLEEAFRDYSRKVELFTYTANSRHFLSTQSLPFKQPDSPGLKDVFAYYFKLLDCYVRWHFLPSGYEDKGFSTVNEQIYSLKTRITEQKELILVTPQLPSGYPFLKELEYACRRINEREIIFNGKQRLWLSVE